MEDIIQFQSMSGLYLFEIYKIKIGSDHWKNIDLEWDKNSIFYKSVVGL